MRTIVRAPMSAVTDPDLNALLHPASAFDHPRDVVNDPDLTTEEKRAILSSRQAQSIPSALTRSWMRFAASIVGRSRNGSACFGANVPAATRSRMEASR
jgi:hypothetical protein